MCRKQTRNYAPPQQKVIILKKHLFEKSRFSDLFDQHGLYPYPQSSKQKSWGSNVCARSQKIKDQGHLGISDDRAEFIARDFKEFIRISGMDDVRTSPYCL